MLLFSKLLERKIVSSHKFAKCKNKTFNCSTKNLNKVIYLYFGKSC